LAWLQKNPDFIEEGVVKINEKIAVRVEKEVIANI